MSEESICHERSEWKKLKGEALSYRGSRAERSPKGGAQAQRGGSGLTPEQEEILSHMSIEFLDDGQGGMHKTIRFTGVNVLIVNGLGATNGFPANPDETNPIDTVVNGTGNLIVGYNELGNPLGDNRTGSHNLVGGFQSNYSSFGGLVVGSFNSVTGPFSSVSGGGLNIASGERSSVSGGFNNIACERDSSISGGEANTASVDSGWTVGCGLSCP